MPESLLKKWPEVHVNLVFAMCDACREVDRGVHLVGPHGELVVCSLCFAEIGIAAMKASVRVG